MPLLYQAVAALVALALATGGGFATGWRAAGNACDARQLAQVRVDQAHQVETTRRAIDQANALAARNAAADGAAVQRRERVEAVTKTIEREVIRYVQTDAGRGLCFDDDGLRLYNAAQRGDFPAADPAMASRGGHAAVPTPAAGGERKPGGDPAHQRRYGAAVPPVPGSPALAGVLGKAQP